ncbi:11346_t:CDS:2 [Racocetra fulgida]|uniref:11346_t:CDS:1 n=1 Tax=Racocetra fulgida TaxID=60492 RepID=A0A9N8VWT8_9GLOM|nr:11346_t:CDS:2 [Racocetra fulgida]
MDAPNVEDTPPPPYDGKTNPLSVNDISQKSTLPPPSPTKLHSSDTSSLSASGSLFDGLDPAKLKQPKRTESAPDIAELFAESNDLSNNQTTSHSAAKSMVNLSTLNQRNASLVNKAFPDTPQQYLEKLRDTLSKSELATLLAKSKDIFHEAVLRTYMETFDFRSDPIDIALRRSRIFGTLKDRRKSSFVRNDPYFVIQHKVPTDFTPLLKDIVPVENIYSYKGTLPELDTVSIHRAFVTAHTVRVTGVRTRGNSESFSPTSSSIHPSDDDEDTFLLKITKAGRLGRKTDMIEVAVYDKSYKKYPNVFRLVCPQGCQYLFQAESESEMNDWIVKINYAATFKTIGLKMRHTWNEENSSNDVHRRADVLRSKIEELQGKIAALTSQLQTDVRFGNNLALMIPYKATTRDRIIQVATVVGRRIKNICLELSRLVCYHEIMEKELCSTIMGDNTYWQKRKSMHRSDESRAYRKHSNVGNYFHNITEGHNKEVNNRPVTMNVSSISSPTPSELSLQTNTTPTTPYTPDSGSLRLPEFEFEIIGSQDIDGFGDITKSNFRDDTSSIMDYVCDDFTEPNTENMEDYNQFDMVEKPKDTFKQIDSNLQTPSNLTD